MLNRHGKNDLFFFLAPMWFLFFLLGSSKVLIGWLKSSRHIGPHVLLYFSWGGGGAFLKYGRAVCYKVGCPDWCATSLKGLKKKIFCFCSFVSLISTVVSITVGGGIPLLSSLFWWFEGKLMRETLQHFLSKWEMFFVFFFFFPEEPFYPCPNTTTGKCQKTYP